MSDPTHDAGMEVRREVLGDAHVDRAVAGITLALLTALGHGDELAMHVRAALRNGLGADEIAEVLLHTAVYAGVPAANSAFARAQAVLREEGAL
jgi:4-carboxymuconolactone decarboxylase